MTNNFDLSTYETVKERKARYYSDYPDARIIVEQVNEGESLIEFSEFKAYVYKSAEDQASGLPHATGHALELRDTELSISRSGNEYESVNYTSWTENAEESAIGRALDNAGYAGAPSREEMKKVKHHSEILSNTSKKSPTDSPDTTQKSLSGNNNPRDSKGHTYCSECGKVVSLRVEKYSMDKYGKSLCMTCQTKNRSNG